MKRRAIAVLAILALFVAGVLWAGENPGELNITLSGGKKADVPFPHKMHQNGLKDCAKCHSLFPREKGVIEKLKSENGLKSKEVMNQCRGCHKEMKKAGKSHGPVSCRGCHKIK